MLICDMLDEKLGLPKERPPRHLIRFVTDRPGHDRRYALDIIKIQEMLGWQPQVTFEQGIRMTIDWYLENPEWVEEILNGSYREYYQKQYGKK